MSPGDTYHVPVASIENRGDSWRVVWRLNGRKQYTTWDDLDHAEQAKAIAEAHRHQLTDEQVYRAILGEPEPEPTAFMPTLREWCGTWLQSKTRITSATRAGYQRQLESRIFPVLGGMPVDAIKPSDIGNLVNALRADGLTNSTLTRYYAVLHAALAAAVADGLRTTNPCTRSDFVRDQVEDTDTGEVTRVYLTPAEYQLLRAAMTPFYQPLLDTMVGTGVRWSEATALQVGDLLPLSRQHGPRLRVARAWKRNGATGSFYLGTTKGRQTRNLRIDDDLHAAIAHDSIGQAPGDSLYQSAQGAPLLYSNFYHRHWKRAVIKANICHRHPPASRAAPAKRPGRCGDFGGVGRSGKPCGRPTGFGLDRCTWHSGPAPDAMSSCDCPDVLHVQPTPHDLRHTHAAWLFTDPDVGVLAISRRLGHASLKTTSEIYGGLTPAAEEATVAAIAAAMGRGAAASQSSA